jgi:hypothetical protein
VAVIASWTSVLAVERAVLTACWAGLTITCSEELPSVACTLSDDINKDKTVTNMAPEIDKNKRFLNDPLFIIGLL